MFSLEVKLTTIEQNCGKIIWPMYLSAGITILLYPIIQYNVG